MQSVELTSENSIDFEQSIAYNELTRILVHDTATNTLNLAKDIQQLAQNFALSNAVVSAILIMLRKHGHSNLPKDARTLRQTPQNVGQKIIDVTPGKYVI